MISRSQVATEAGRWLALSLPRRLLTDLSHLARGFPRATLVIRINVAALMAPRDQARIPWPVVFAKAYALDSITDFRRALAIARLPLPLRRLLIWYFLPLQYVLSL
jgi:hypothetical protein